MDKDVETLYLTNLALDDHSAFYALYSYYFPKIRYFIGRLIKSQTEAQDLSQDVFEKIWMVRKNLSGIESLSSYIYRMAINTVLNYLKKKNHHNSYLEYLCHNPGSQVTTEEAIYVRDIEILILLAVNNMPPRRRKIFEMSRFKELKNIEIANQINISKKTVEVQLSLALKEIRKIIPSLMFLLC